VEIDGNKIAPRGKKSRGEVASLMYEFASKPTACANKLGKFLGKNYCQNMMAENQTKSDSLFAVYLGGRAPRCNTELHDVVFIAAESVPAGYEKILAKWFGNPARMHIDSWCELSAVDGYRICLREEPAPPSPKLFFINLGGYQPGEFAELHANAFVVAAGEAEVKQRAKAELLRGKVAVHTDDLFDIDDCLEITEVDRRHIHLEPIAETPPLIFHSAYHIIPPEIVSEFLRRKS
jgi:Domain of Unknown Function (DUF1543)